MKEKLTVPVTKTILILCCIILNSCVPEPDVNPGSTSLASITSRDVWENSFSVTAPTMWTRICPVAESTVVGFVAIGAMGEEILFLNDLENDCLEPTMLSIHHPILQPGISYSLRIASSNTKPKFTVFAECSECVVWNPGVVTTCESPWTLIDSCNRRGGTIDETHLPNNHHITCSWINTNTCWEEVWQSCNDIVYGVESVGLCRGGTDPAVCGLE